MNMTCHMLCYLSIEESTSEVIETELLSEANDDSEEEFESEVGSSASVDVPVFWTS